MTEPVQRSGDALADMLAADGYRPRQTFTEAMIEERFAETRRRAGRPSVREERWVEDGSMDGGHWELVEERAS